MPQPARNRIGFLRHTFLPPSETFIYRSIQVLDRFTVSAFAIRRRSEQKFPHADVVALRDGRLGILEAWLYGLTTYSPRFYRWARGVRLVHAHMGYTGVHALGVTRRYGLPLVTSFYGADVTIARSQRRWHPDFWRYMAQQGALWRQSDLVFVLSSHMREELVTQGCPPRKIRVVPLGIDTARFRGNRRVRQTTRPAVLMVGREVEKKGFDCGLRACAAAREAGVDLEVLFLGLKAEGFARLQALAQKLSLPVEWLDPATSVVDTMARADLLLVPSQTATNGDQEGTPTVICEGGASGLPVVSTFHAGIPEQVDDGRTGLLAPERDHQTLAQHIVRLAREPELRYEMGCAGRNKMEHEYSLRALRENLQNAYDELLT